MARRPHSSQQTLAVLAALLESGSDWRHGVRISRDTGLKPGTLYPLLIRLHSAGYLDSEWQPAERPGRPPRHAYRLNVAGRALASERLAERSTQLKPA